ncbi:MAG: methyltransferase domain-containing protein [Candidatus Lokiarchaeota archaeon]|nr:methyltransferase domain-containing protein [Candidatus Lokiarchaeota archaeon]
MSKENFFDDIGPGYEGVAEFYELFSDNTDLPFYLEYAQRCGSPILDIAAGTGRVTRYLAQQGFHVTALESSPSMLQHSKYLVSRLTPEVRSRIELVSGNMMNFSLDRKYSLIIIPNSFGHAMTTGEQLSTLQSIHKHLSDDGLFILDLFPGAVMNEHAKFQDNPTRMQDGRTVIREGEFHVDFVKQILRLDLRYVVFDKQGIEENEVMVTSGASVIFNREADLLIHFSGFEVEQELGGFDSSPYTIESGRRIFILRKRKMLEADEGV